jgi:hypothetical protein
VDQDAAERVEGERVKHLEDGAEFGLSFAHVRAVSTHPGLRPRTRGLELPILPNAHTEVPGGATDAESPTFAIASEHLGERCHDRRL